MALQGNDWLAQTIEPTLEPEIPICDPYHHFGNTGQNSAPISAIFCRIWLTISTAVTMSVPRFSLRQGLVTIRTVRRRCGPWGSGIRQWHGEVSATGQYGIGRVAAGIIDPADLKLGERVRPVLEGLQAASPNRFRGLCHSVGWDPHPELEN